jgi:hypothetical protein
VWSRNLENEEAKARYRAVENTTIMGCNARKTNKQHLYLCTRLRGLPIQNTPLSTEMEELSVHAVVKEIVT